MRALAERAARPYIVGPDLSDAVRASRSLDARGFRSTIGFWNRVEDRPADIAARYLSAIDAIGTERIDGRLSVKAPPLQFSRDLFGGIVERARDRDVGIQFDSLWPESTDETFSLLSELVRTYANLGCTLPGRWRRSPEDADRAIELGLAVRIVKGQWPDSQGPEIDPRSGFLAIVDRLAGRVRHASVATHDVGLAREALARLRAAGTPCELELLYGLPLRNAIAAARTEGVSVRVYLPYGHGFLPYAMQQLKSHPRLALQILRVWFEPRRSVFDLPPMTPRPAARMSASRESTDRALRSRQLAVPRTRS
jgi:proline dehydrogenase